MLHTIQNYKRFMTGLGLAAIMTVAVAAPAFAADTVTIGITSAGSLSASYADKPLAGVTYSLADQTTASENLTLTAADGTGTGAGWNVTVVSSDFVYSGSNSGTDIPAANFTFGTPGTPTAVGVDSQAVSVTAGQGPEAVGTGGAMNVTREVIQAGAGYGQGTYDQTVGATLLVPAKSRVGTYTGTLTTTIASGPGL